LDVSLFVDGKSGMYQYKVVPELTKVQPKSHQYTSVGRE